MDLGLKDKRAFVGGGSRGIGKAIALELAREGCDVVIASRTKSALDEAAKEIDDITGRKIIPMVLDVTSREDVDRVMAEAASQLGGLDILVNSASLPGGSPGAIGPIDTVVDDELIGDFDVKYVGALRCARAAQAGGAARFVVVSALGASARSPSWYSRVKAAMEAEVQQLGFEAVHILRPSLLLGPRDEHRPGEALGQRLAPAINWALPPSWRAIDVSDVAGAMLETAQRKVTGTWVHELPLSESRSRKVA